MPVNCVKPTLDPAFKNVVEAEKVAPPVKSGALRVSVALVVAILVLYYDAAD